MISPRALSLFALFLAPLARADDAGATVWMSRCKGCHGLDGRAQTPVGEKEKIPDFSSVKWQKAFADPDVREVVAHGSPSNSKMKPYEERLSPAEIDAVVRYIRTLRSGT